MVSVNCPPSSGVLLLICWYQIILRDVQNGVKNLSEVVMLS